jgi:hypothetical protein
MAAPHILEKDYPCDINGLVITLNWGTKGPTPLNKYLYVVQDSKQIRQGSKKIWRAQVHVPVELEDFVGSEKIVLGHYEDERDAAYIAQEFYLQLERNIDLFVTDKYKNPELPEWKEDDGLERTKKFSEYKPSLKYTNKITNRDALVKIYLEKKATFPNLKTVKGDMVESMLREMERFNSKNDEERLNSAMTVLVAFDMSGQPA